MIILGQKYRFTELEKIRLDKKFKKIIPINYADRVQNEILDEISAAMDERGINLLVLNTKAKVGDEIIKYLTALQFEKRKKIRILSIEHFLEEFLHKCYIPEDHTDLDFLESIKPFNPLEYALKRTIDYLGVSVVVLLTWPIMLYARQKIKQESPGTSMFKQLRVGENNVEFKCLKFRSMHLNSHHDPYTKENDTRVFPWGNFMRKTRIDELPQLLNVLRGDMHFIGPRAEWNILVKNYEEQIPYYSERHLVKPGITGWAQVMYPYGANAEDAKQKLMYDLYYIKHWSLFLEIKVIYKTILVVLGKKGI